MPEPVAPIWSPDVLVAPAPTGPTTAPAVTDRTVVPAAPAGASPTDVTAPTLPAGSPVGFGTTAAVVTKADGTECEICLWLAETPGQRSKGLKYATDLAGADGMAFRYPSARDRTFWMKNVEFPLSIVFYSASGDYLGAFDMLTCFDSTCVNYATPPDFVVAVEVPSGELGDHGMGAGSRLELLDIPCLTP